ncbi:LacI family DNA-binding transcriptional regulator [Mangrovibacterium diazotrophicum]|uniref:LacI family transcriptional regulator n=1 Tax=Mangrovibacterium diazotrophicum TaxID=1261403 RepID=A0A419W6D3_9BACT|nr:substrate-binding domain-containing protein [Mangrovibacterium diazotrophicum]RKD91031.1 LacI family transcriptional regulator [Mangrovibacterium diazotrophicum]
MDQFKNIRIKDVAELAGVSVATVDRVLHERGKISEKAKAKVLEALEKTGYKPNLIASTLGSNKVYRIAAMLPDPALDDYWNQSGSGIFKATEEWAQYNVRIESFYFNLYDKKSFKQVSKKILDFNPDSVLLAPIQYHESLEFFGDLKERNIPYVIFNTNIPEADPLSFIGQDLYQSGRVGAEMIATKLGTKGNILVVHVYEEKLNAMHVKEKEKGFRDYFTSNNLTDFNIESYEFTDFNDAAFMRELQDVLSKRTIDGIFVATSKGTHLTAQVLDKAGKKNVALVGYDLLKDNIHYMYEGVINFLIHQNPRKQAVRGINFLVNYLLFKKQPPVNDLFPLEIITRENIKSYLHSDSI